MPTVKGEIQHFYKAYKTVIEIAVNESLIKIMKSITRKGRTY